MEKIIIDGGAMNGDTALMFHHYFPNSLVHMFEPVISNCEIIKKFLAVDNCNNKLVLFQQGLANEDGEIEVEWHTRNRAKVTTIDKIYQKNNQKNRIDKTRYRVL